MFSHSLHTLQSGKALFSHSLHTLRYTCHGYHTHSTHPYKGGASSVCDVIPVQRVQMPPGELK